MNGEKVNERLKEIYSKTKKETAEIESKFLIQSRAVSEQISQKASLSESLVAMILENSSGLNGPEYVVGRMKQQGKSRETARQKLRDQRREVGGRREEAIESQEELAKALGLVRHEMAIHTSKAEDAFMEKTGGISVINEYNKAKEVLYTAEQKLEVAEADANAKRPTFENDPFFAYLLKKGFGTNEYQGNAITAIFDRILAKYCHFQKNHNVYVRFIQVPEMIQKHIEQLRERIQPLERKYKFGLSDSLSGNIAFKNLEIEEKELVKKENKVNSEISELVTLENNLERELSLFNSGKDSYANSISENLNKLMNENHSQITKIVESSDNTEDNSLWEQIQKLNALIETTTKLVAMEKKNWEQSKDDEENVRTLIMKIERENLEDPSLQIKDPVTMEKFIENRSWDKVLKHLQNSNKVYS